MEELTSTAERLRCVKEACRQFLTRWALECAAERMADSLTTGFSFPTAVTPFSGMVLNRRLSLDDKEERGESGD